jgi:chemotaxis protein methyltransferase CheR
LRKRARALHLEGLSEYISFLRSPSGEEEVTGLMDAISTNVTDFFRERDHFDFLRQTVLPEWEKSEAGHEGRAFAGWSAACSSGEEPYTLAIELSEYFQLPRKAEWSITASDISTRMLDRAQEGIYPHERVKLPDAELLRRYFQRGTGKFEGYYRIKSEVRRRVAFQRQNLFEWPYPFRQKFDVIFCRNVMIYFDRKTQEQLVPRLKEQLVPGGYLFVGHSESLIGIDHTLKCVRPSIYRRGSIA